MIVTYNYLRKEKHPIGYCYYNYHYFKVGNFQCELEDFIHMIFNKKFQNDLQCGQVVFADGTKWIFNWFYSDLRFFLIESDNRQLDLFGYPVREPLRGISAVDFANRYFQS